MKASQRIVALAAVVVLAGLWLALKPAPSPRGASAGLQTFELALGDGSTWAPQRFRVQQGDQVRFEVTSTVDDAMHVHGYEKHLPLPAGEPQLLEFTADRVGQHMLELHGSELDVGTLEVYPRS